MHLLRALKRANALLGDLEALTGAARVHSVPPHLEVDPSSQCNFRCLMCHQSKLEMGNARLGASDIDVLVDRLPYVDRLMIAGLGEPLLSPNIEPLLRQAARFGCRTHVFTNGELIQQRLDALKLANRVSVSFDGATRETFETLRPGANFPRILDNIRALRAAAPQAEIVTSTVVSRRNLHEIAAIVQLARTLGMDEVHLAPVDHTPELALRPMDAAAYREQLAAARAQAALGGPRIHDAIHPRHFDPGRNTEVSAQDRARAPAAPVAVRAPVRWQPTPARHGAAPRPPIHHLGPARARIEIARRLAVQLARIGVVFAGIRLGRSPATLPYCSAPWKYGFARSRGDARLCPYADVSAGSIHEAFGASYNTPLLEGVRASFGTGTPTLDVCSGCSDDHRGFRRAELQRRLDRLGAPRSRQAADRPRA
jgi:MoaA/NifB/PqqE/SkfB family radical SAM enzyme